MCKFRYSTLVILPSCGVEVLNPDFAVGVVARRLKPKRNAQLEQFFDEGISVDMVRKKIVKQALQQGFASRSRWLLQILGLTIYTVKGLWTTAKYIVMDKSFPICQNSLKF